MNPLRNAGLLVLSIGLAVAAGATPSREKEKGATLVERARLTGSIFHYVFEVQVADEPFSSVRVHRVVKVKGEAGHGDKQIRPVETEHGVFLVHGSAGLFANAFLAGTLPSAEPAQSLAVFLAERGIDVWGVDLAWSPVAFDEPDLAFMSDWGLERQIREVSLALDLALSKRGRYKNRGMHLLGYSLGGVIGYAFVNDEAGRPCGQRRVKGFIPFDTSVKSDDPAATTRACEAASATDAMLGGGTFRDGTNALASQVGFLARTDPGGASPVFAGFTNQQVALVVLALSSHSQRARTTRLFTSSQVFSMPKRDCPSISATSLCHSPSSGSKLSAAERL